VTRRSRNRRSIECILPYRGFEIRRAKNMPRAGRSFFAAKSNSAIEQIANQRYRFWLFLCFQRRRRGLHVKRAENFHGAGQRTLSIFWLPP